MGIYMKRSFLYRIALLVCILLGETLAVSGDGRPPSPSKSPMTVNIRALFRIHLPALSPTASPFEPGPGPLVFLFLSPDCPLCKSYSVIINQLYKEFGSGARFYGIIPGTTDSREKIDSFIAKYHILFPLYRDTRLSVVKMLHAEVTPQAIVLDARGAFLYTGLIDDRVAALGQQRNQASHHYLREALDAGVAGQPPATTRTTPVGCLINAF